MTQVEEIENEVAALVKQREAQRRKTRRDIRAASFARASETPTREMKIADIKALMLACGV